MFATGLRGYQPLCLVVILVFVLGSRCITGRPHNSQERETGQGSPQPALRFSPELLLEPSLESAVSPLNVLPQPSPPSPPPPPPASPAGQNGADDHKDTPAAGGDDPRGFREDLDGPEEKWEQDPDVEDSESPPIQQRPSKIPDLPEHKVIVPPVVEDDVNVDRFHGVLLGSHQEDVSEDLDVPELRLKTRVSDPVRAASANSAYIHPPRKPVDQGIPSPELIAKDVDVDGPPLPSPRIPMPDDVPADPRKVVPWPDMLQKDIDVDRPIHHDASSPRSEPASHTEDASLQQWKSVAMRDLDVDEATASNASGDDEDETATDVEVDSEKNPFVDDSDEEENEVPEELVREIVKAMKAPPSWRHATPSKQEAQDLWDDSEDDDAEYDEYLDWLLSDQTGPRDSRLITLIFETIGAEDEMLEEEEEEGETSEDEFERELSIWQVLTNFPFPMLVGHDDDLDVSFDVEYVYDDYEDYDDEDYEDDYYDEYDDEDYEDYDDDDDDDDEGDYDDDDDGKDEDSDELDDYFYSEEYDECNDCVEKDGEAKQEITVLSLPPILNK